MGVFIRARVYSCADVQIAAQIMEGGASPPVEKSAARGRNRVTGRRMLAMCKSCLSL